MYIYINKPINNKIFKKKCTDEKPSLKYFNLKPKYILLTTVVDILFWYIGTHLTL